MNDFPSNGAETYPLLSPAVNFILNNGTPLTISDIDELDEARREIWDRCNKAKEIGEAEIMSQHADAEEAAPSLLAYRSSHRNDTFAAFRDHVQATYGTTLSLWEAKALWFAATEALQKKSKELVGGFGGTPSYPGSTGSQPSD